MVTNRPPCSGIFCFGVVTDDAGNHGDSHMWLAELLLLVFEVADLNFPELQEFTLLFLYD